MSSFPLATFYRVLDAVLKSATHRHSTLHGESHWRAVAFTALELAPQVPSSDPLVGLLFGLIHDSQRLNDGGDPQHGPRAGVFTRSLVDQGILPLSADRVDLLVDAIHHHTAVKTTNNPTIGLCWDADRLNLWRIGIEPHPSFLSTTAAKIPATIAAHKSLPGQHVSWTSLYDKWVQLDKKE